MGECSIEVSVVMPCLNEARTVGRCIDKMGKDFLANDGTVNVARDLDAIRAALGDEKLTYLGYSYGTRIGSAYAEAFPHNVRAMVLDGAVDPNQNIVDESVAQGTGFLPVTFASTSE